MKNENLTYDWLEFVTLQKSHKKNISEELLKNLVSGRNIALAKAVGAYEQEVISLSGDFIKFGDGNWAKQNIVSVKLINGGRAQFHKNFADQLKNTFEASCRATGWTPENPSVGYCPKPNGGFVQRRSRAPSEVKKPVEQRQIGGHAWGTSIDLGSATENPMGGGGKIRQFPQFIETMKKGGFIWGGDWGVKDDMHFEVNLSGTPLPPTEEQEIQHFSSDNYFSSGTGGFSWEGAVQSITGEIKESLEKKLFDIQDSSEKQIYQKYQKYFDALLNFLKKELKITKPVKIVFEEDKKNSKKPLGRTGGYLNEENKIHIFITGRHIKDVMRSLAHEMVHHRQNIRGEFKKAEPTTKGYAQKNPHLRKMEKEAFLKGNMLFRDWEDNYKYRGEK